MKRALKSPAFNAVCISIFSAFYSLIFIATSRGTKMANTLYYISIEHPSDKELFWVAWSRFLSAGYHAYIACALIALTAAVVLTLVLRRGPYDEYHVDRLLSYLVAAIISTLAIIGVFYVLILSNPDGIVEKFTLFIVIHWATVVFANFIFALVCRWK